mmetsp:Transcript_118007/g.252033  ORF Transcript_118007/g.252033 Transcript_118007/m.252033 type:complete len:272 (-) Transcript_118007:74-889(-)
MSTSDSDNICWSYTQKGHCKWGSDCRWLHPAPKAQSIVCRAWELWGECPRAECRWAHPPKAPGQSQGWSVMWCPDSTACLPPWVGYCQEGFGIEEVGGRHAFKTDDEISQVRREWAVKSPGRPLLPWKSDREEEQHVLSIDGEEIPMPLTVSLEDTDDKIGLWDQFEVNRQKFGVVTTFKEDLSQYTTPLHMGQMPKSVRRKAKLVASEIEAERQGRLSPTTQAEDCDNDEEAKFSSVGRTSGEQHRLAGLEQRAGPVVAAVAGAPAAAAA